MKKSLKMALVGVVALAGINAFYYGLCRSQQDWVTMAWVVNGTIFGIGFSMWFLALLGFGS